MANPNSKQTQVMKKHLTTLGLLFTLVITAAAQNKKPTLSGLTYYEVFAGQQICITINTHDSDINDSTIILWNKGIPNGLWSTSNGVDRFAKATFCWTADEDDASQLPYKFWAYATDGKDTTYKSYSILIQPNIKGERQFINTGNGKWTFNYSYVNPYFSGATFTWFVPKQTGTGAPNTVLSTNRSLIYNFTNAGKYVIKSQISWKGTVNSYYDTISVDSSFFPTGLSGNTQMSTLCYISDCAVKVKVPGLFHVALFDINGRQVLLNETGDEALVDMSRFQAGLYLLKIEQENRVETHKIIRR